MAALGAVGTRVTATPNPGLTLISLVTAATVTHTDTITVDLSAYGCKNVHAVLGCREDTAGSIVVAENPTTSVTSGTLTLTVPGAGGAKVRSWLIWAY